ncbi:hypothetical protein PoB_001280600 [Plakobranchus ocellatus]|uniref:Uncharacterized protein n=1 Tax=Plakobranchus ocellatus TaxID=259542 RepID=A0AAV3YG50_9GAST|nr:hypothetical protein PoB_001280600 [Plakobranchus ocellatus]
MFVNTTNELVHQKFQAVLADLNKTQSVNETLKKYSEDPYLPRYVEMLKQKQANSLRKNITIWQSLKALVDSRYIQFRRSIRMSRGAVYCLLTGSSFEEFRNATYAWENRHGVTSPLVSATTAD